MPLFTPKRDIQALASDLAERIAKRYPPHLDQQPGKRPSVNRLTRIIEDACKQAQEFQQKTRLGWLARARLGNEFRWRLLEAGYSKDFAQLATEAILVYLNRPSQPAAGSQGKG